MATASQSGTWIALDQRREGYGHGCSLASGTISFGLVAIPIRLYPATVPERVSFHLLHAKCGNRIKYQTYCPVCDQVVERNDLIKGYEFGKGQYIRVTEDELEALEGEASKDIDITEFVPLASVDPVYLDKAYYLGPDKGGSKPWPARSRRQSKSPSAGSFSAARRAWCSSARSSMA